MDKPAPCDIEQHADESICYSCGLKWKTDSPAAPACVKNQQRRADDLPPEPPYFALALVPLVGILLLIHWLLSGAR